MIVTYRFVKKKYNERKQRQAAAAAQTDVDGPVSVSEHHRQPLEQSEPAPTVQELSSQETPKDRSEIIWNLMLLAAVALPVFFETIDYTVVATAQVKIASIFNRLDLQSYIGTVYLLTSTVFLPPFASIADIFGRHLALQLALIFFMVGSAISTGSNDMPTMLVGRGVAGIGAAGMLAVVRIILTDSGSLNQNNWQQAMLFVLYTLGFCIGPWIGGLLVSVSYRWIFAINLPCCAVAIVLAFLILRGRTKGSQPSHRLPSNTSRPSARESFVAKILRVDWIGAALFMVGGVLLLLALNWGSNEVWNQAKVIACFVVGGLAIVAFIVWEYFLERQELSANSTSFRLRATEPMIPLEVFRSLDICVVMFGTFVNGMVMLVMFYFVAIFFVIVTGLSPTKSGVQLIFFAPGMGGGSLISIQLVKLTRQPKYCIMLGTLVSTVALGLISMGMDQNKQDLVKGFMAMAGVGTGLCMGPLAVQARFAQPADRNAIVSALTLFFRSFGGTVGLAQCGAVLNGKVTSMITHLIASGAVSPADAAAIARASAAGIDSSTGIDALPEAAQQIVRDAFRQGSRWAFLSLVPWCAIAFLMSLALRNIKDGDRRAGEGEGVEERKMEEREKGEVVNASPKV